MNQYHFVELHKHKEYKENETNENDRTKSTPASEQKIVSLPKSTGHQDNSSHIQKQSNKNKTGQSTHTPSKHVLKKL